MSRPSFQFYPDNWRNNSNLRRCSWAARGVWVEVICLMHDSDRYGTLGWTLKEIAQALGCPMALLKELAAKGVLKGCDAGECEPMVYTPRSGRKDGEPITLLATQPGPIWYSSRMLRDEYVRLNAGASSRFGGTKQDTAPPAGGAPDPSPSRRRGEDQSDGSPSSSSSPPSEVKEPSLRSGLSPAAPTTPAGPASAAPDARTALFREGLDRAVRLTGKPPAACRAMLGRWLRDAGDDAALLGLVLAEAEVSRPADPSAWVVAAIQARVGLRHSPQRQPANTGLRAAALANFQTIRPIFDLESFAEELPQ